MRSETWYTAVFLHSKTTGYIKDYLCLVNFARWIELLYILLASYGSVALCRFNWYATKSCYLTTSIGKITLVYYLLFWQRSMSRASLVIPMHLLNQAFKELKTREFWRLQVYKIFRFFQDISGTVPVIDITLAVLV